ncbi:hypothetical protein IW262DRAFT_1401798, partial [Armillaria fumosa]
MNTMKISYDHTNQLVGTAIQLMQCTVNDAPRRGVHLQERQGNVTVDFGLNGDLYFEIKVKTELQSGGRCDSLALRTADDLLSEDGGRLGMGRCELGLWVRHGDTEEIEVRLLGLLCRYRQLPLRIRLGLEQHSRCIVAGHLVLLTCTFEDVEEYRRGFRESCRDYHINVIT